MGNGRCMMYLTTTCEKWHQVPISNMNSRVWTPVDWRALQVEYGASAVTESRQSGDSHDARMELDAKMQPVGPQVRHRTDRLAEKGEWIAMETVESSPGSQSGLRRPSTTPHNSRFRASTTVGKVGYNIPSWARQEKHGGPFGSKGNGREDMYLRVPADVPQIPTSHTHTHTLPNK